VPARVSVETGVRMIEILIENLDGRRIPVIPGTRPLLFHLQDHFIDWMHACGGKGKCTTCKVIIVHGAENAAPLTPAEHRYMRNGGLMQGERLACQMTFSGDVAIQVPQECKLPHIRYSDDK
jgi:ferredoxin, 2Fe-2S